MNYIKNSLFISILVGIHSLVFAKPVDMYFATTADTEHYEWVCKLIKSIETHNKKHIREIAVFDLGLTQKQCDVLMQNQHVKIYQVELVHPDLLTKFTVNLQGKKVRGYYAWKPVVLKQALDLFPYVLYIDAGFKVNRDLKPIFRVILKDGYFLLSCGHAIAPMTTTFVKNKFNLDDTLLQQEGIAGGLQGHTHALYDSYIMPMYELAHDLQNFYDDGSSPWGFGGGRHDQTLFSIYARRLQVKTYKFSEQDTIFIKNKYVPYKTTDFFTPWAYKK